VAVTARVSSRASAASRAMNCACAGLGTVIGKRISAAAAPIKARHGGNAAIQGFRRFVVAELKQYNRGMSGKKDKEARRLARIQEQENAALAKEKKPVDRWLGLVGIAVGIIFGFLPKTPLVVVFWLVVTFALLVHPIWNFWWVERAAYRRVAALIVLTVILTGIGWTTWPPAAQEAVKQPAAESPTILVRYSQGELPLPVPPRSSSLVLQLTPQVTDQTLEVPNDSANQNWWPARPRNRAKEPTMGSMYVCELTNQSDKALLNIQLLFDLKFISAEPAKASLKRNPDGTSSISVDMDSTRKDDPMSFAFVDAKRRTIAATSGKLVSSHTHRVTVPSIAAHATATVYLVSQTNLFSQFTLPPTATVIVDGNPNPRAAVLIRPAMNPVDKVPRWGLNPSVYKWTGIKDSVLDLDSYVAQR
jgi:predicted secreted protein